MTSPNIAVVIVKKEGLVITVAVKAQAHLASQHELKATDPGSNSGLPRDQATIGRLYRHRCNNDAEGDKEENSAHPGLKPKKHQPSGEG